MAMMSFTYGFAGIALFTILTPLMQIIARRAGSPIAPVAILAIAAVISHVASVLLGFATVQQFQYWNAASLFSFGAMLYVFAFGAVYKSVSLEILLDLAQRPGHTAALSDIVDRKVPEIFRGRTDILVSGPGRAHRSILRSHRGRPRGCRSDRANAQRVRHRRYRPLRFSDNKNAKKTPNS